eukprot:5772946-Alexandrium_andersonii.AAC.1
MATPWPITRGCRRSRPPKADGPSSKVCALGAGGAYPQPKGPRTSAGSKPAGRSFRPGHPLRLQPHPRKIPIVLEL